MAGAGASGGGAGGDRPRLHSVTNAERAGLPGDAPSNPHAGAKAGETVRVAITWLEMTARPEGPYPPLPLTAPVSLIRAEAPPPAYFRYLYDLVGEEWEWTDRHADAPEDQAAWLADPAVSLISMLHRGWPAGFFVLDGRAEAHGEGVVDLAYFGISSRALGQGLGRWLLGEAIRAGWARPGCAKMTVNTCSLDHPRALPMYQRFGFRPVRRTEVERVMTRDRPA